MLFRSLETCRVLLQARDVDVHATNRKLKTPLHLAAQGGHLEIISDLTEAIRSQTKAADLVGRLIPLTEQGESPLWLALEKGHRQASLHLISLLASDFLDRPRNDNVTAAMMAQQKGFNDVYQAIRDKLDTVHLATPLAGLPQKSTESAKILKSARSAESLQSAASTQPLLPTLSTETLKITEWSQFAESTNQPEDDRHPLRSPFNLSQVQSQKWASSCFHVFRL